MKLTELVNQKEAIKRLSEKALEYFSASEDRNIFEDDTSEFKIVKVLNKDVPSYYLTYDTLGKGAFGEVSEAVGLDIEQGSITSDLPVAIKITDFSEQGFADPREIESAKNRTIAEFNLLDKIDQSYGFSIGKRLKEVPIPAEKGCEIFLKETMVQEAVVAMPLFPGKDMSHADHKHQPSYGSVPFVSLAAELSRSLKKLHDLHVIHADLKPANVIWDAKEGYVNIVDFNRARVLPPNEESFYEPDSSDKDYMAPESLASEPYKYSKASDIYSLGKTLFEKLTIHANPKPYLGYDQLILKPFIQKMMTADEHQRPTAADCVDFFSRIEKKMQLDIDASEKNNALRLKLNRLLIEIEVYANTLQKEINTGNQKPNDFLVKHRLIADKNKKYQQSIDAINLLVKALSSEKIDVELLKQNSDLLLRSDKSANGILSYKGRYNKIVAGLGENLAENNPVVNPVGTKQNAILSFALKYPKLTAGIVGLFIAALVVASVFSCGAVAGAAVAVGAAVGLSGTSSLIAGTAIGAVSAGLLVGGAAFFAAKVVGRPSNEPPASVAPVTTP